jgi:alkylation response protein AidB-like acyl-CoA dehydrogenase
MWITNGPEADALVVYAKTTPAAGARVRRQGHAPARLSAAR